MRTFPKPSGLAARTDERRLYRWASMVVHVALLLSLLSLLPLFAQQGPQDSNPFARVDPPHPLTVGGKLRWQLKETYGPGSLLSMAASAGLNQWRDFPPEWGQGMEGYGRRYASRIGQKTVDSGIRFVVGTALRHDPRYFPSEGKGCFSRLGHALVYTFVARTDSGRRTFAVARFAGAFGGAFVSNTWYPAGVNDTSHALGRAGYVILGEAGANVVREFWPDVKRAFRRP